MLPGEEAKSQKETFRNGTQKSLEDTGPVFLCDLAYKYSTIWCKGR